MGSVCGDHSQNQNHQRFHYKKSFREIDVPPRKLHRRATAALEHMEELLAEEKLTQKFLPCNDGNDDDCDDPYSSDHFRMFEFKVRRCTRSRSHDWTDCPFAHPGEKARRRDPRRFNYSGTVCPEFRRGSCSRGENCEFAHGVFECWLHPARYRTEACKDGKNCKRKVCFFAHTPKQLRLLPVEGSFENNAYHCCAYCHTAITASPNSTLLDMSAFSPPMSPAMSPGAKSGNGFSPISRFGGRFARSDPYPQPQFGDNDELLELVRSLDAMNVNGNDACYNACVDEPQFVPALSRPPQSLSGLARGEEYHGGGASDESVSSAPDFGWVNELLM